jgi:hypothetical protein
MVSDAMTAMHALRNLQCTQFFGGIPDSADQ